MIQNEYYTNYGHAFDQSGFLSHTFRWMFLGLLTTFAAALASFQSGLIWFVFRSPVLLIVLTIAELFVVYRISSQIHQMAPSTAVGHFLIYAVLNGVVFGAYFILFDFASLIFAFAAAAIYFGIMALYGLNTKRDLSGWGSMLSAGLIALLICGVLGNLFGFGSMEILYCGVGLVIFMGLTAYDVQKVLRIGQMACYNGDDEDRYAVLGALELYLDFINIFVFILRLLGRRNRN